MMELAIFLFGIFCGLLLYGLCFNGGSVTPENRTDTMIKTDPKRPVLSEGGVCTVCGYKNAHGWECIGYYMNLACSSYLEHTLAFKKMLEDIQIGRTPSKLIASLTFKKIEATQEMLNELTKS